jgi:hypothetical protein
MVGCAFGVVVVVGVVLVLAGSARPESGESTMSAYVSYLHGT